MITKEIVMIGGKEFMYRVSDKGVKLERDGELYSEAYDPIPVAYERSYTETDITIETVEEGGEENVASNETDSAEPAPE